MDCGPEGLFTVWPPEYPHSPTGLTPDSSSQYGTQAVMIPRSLVTKRIADDPDSSAPKKQKKTETAANETEQTLRKRVQEKMRELEEQQAAKEPEDREAEPSAPKKELDPQFQNFIQNVAAFRSNLSEFKASLDSEEAQKLRAKLLEAQSTNQAIKDTLEETQSKPKEVTEISRLAVAAPKEMDLTKLAQENRGCRAVDTSYEKLGDLAEGAYGKVARAKSIDTGEVVALKRVKIMKEKEGAPITSILMGLQHPNIVNVKEVVLGGKQNLDTFIVMEYVENDLAGLMEHLKSKNKEFSLAEVKGLTSQLLSGLLYLHDNWIIHRDLKTPNLLYSNQGTLKIADFGLAREYGDPIKPYTPLVVTLYYRAPELLLGTKLYCTPIDMWSAGCIFAELLLMQVLWKGSGEIDQLNRIFTTLGSPNESIWPAYPELPLVKKSSFVARPYSKLKEKFRDKLSDRGLDLMQGLLTYDPDKRLTAEEALRHSWFTEFPLAPSAGQPDFLTPRLDADLPRLPDQQMIPRD